MTNLFSKYLFLLFTFSVLISCESVPKTPTLKTGFWRGEITIQKQQVPFVFEIVSSNNEYKINLHDGDNIIELDEVTVVNDSLFFTLHIFDIDVKAKINDNSLSGVYTKNYADNYVLSFKAAYGKETRVDNPKTSTKFDGQWDFWFEGDDDNNKKVGIFKSDGNQLKGSVLSKTGDYRFLEGTSTDKDFTLYAFDGNHIFIFKATLENDSTFTGDYWSGKTAHKKFRAVRNENAALPDANSLTYLKDGYVGMEFSFPGLDGKPISLTDEKYKDKVVILQLFGTWCPNCMDETKFLTKWYDNNKNRGVEIIGLAYEVKDDFDYAKTRVQKMKEKYSIGYDFVIAGTSESGNAAKSLPMLNHVMSFPTAIIIDKKGKVRNIHTGFSGPATGDYYLDYVHEFNTLMDILLAE